VEIKELPNKDFKNIKIDEQEFEFASVLQSMPPSEIKPARSLAEGRAERRRSRVGSQGLGGPVDTLERHKSKRASLQKARAAEEPAAAAADVEEPRSHTVSQTTQPHDLPFAEAKERQSAIEHEEIDKPPFAAVTRHARVDRRRSKADSVGSVPSEPGTTKSVLEAFEKVEDSDEERNKVTEEAPRKHSSIKRPVASLAQVNQASPQQAAVTESTPVVAASEAIEAPRPRTGRVLKARASRPPASILPGGGLDLAALKKAAEESD